MFASICTVAPAAAAEHGTAVFAPGGRHLIVIAGFLAEAFGLGTLDSGFHCCVIPGEAKQTRAAERQTRRSGLRLSVTAALPRRKYACSVRAAIDRSRECWTDGPAAPISRAERYEGYMTTFDDRERAFETKFAHDEEMRFRIIARRNRLLGAWAARQMGLSEAEAESYAKDVVRADFEEAGDHDVVRKVLGDLTAAGIECDEAGVSEALRNKEIEARRQIIESSNL
jgi:hypothetical protein